MSPGFVFKAGLLRMVQISKRMMKKLAVPIAVLVAMCCVLASLVLPLSDLWPRSTRRDSQTPTQSTPPAGTSDVDRCLQQAQDAMVANDWPAAHSAALQILDIVPEHVPALLVCGQALAMSDQNGQALDMFRRLPRSNDENVLAGRTVAIRLAMNAGRLTAARHHCLAILEQQPSNREALTQVGAIYCMTGQARKARHYLSQTVNAPGVPLDYLVWVTQPTAALDNDHFERLVSWNSAGNDPDPAVLVAIAFWHTERQEWPLALAAAESAVRADSNAENAKGLIAKASVELGVWDKVADWQRYFSASPESEFAYSALATLAKNTNQKDLLLQSLIKASKANPLRRRYAWQVSQQLLRAGEAERAKPYQIYAQMLERERLLRTQVVGNEPTVGLLLEMMEVTAATGRRTEAEAFFNQGVARGASLEQRQAAVHLLAKYETPDHDLWATSPALQVGSQASVEAAGKPLTESTTPRQSEHSPVTFRFSDVAAKAGLSFLYDNSAGSEQTAFRMHQITGGGVGVIDVDGDLWPDAWFCQGGRKTDATSAADQLFRNDSGRRFQNVTDVAGLSDAAFGQGLSVGDLNVDGFADVYVANLGANQQWRNNGDGTFSEVTRQDSPESDVWTTSCAIVDADQDGLVDIYNVNYLAASDVTSRVCVDSNGIERSCKPTLFDAAPDQFLKNNGDGTFSDCSDSIGFLSAAGRGLGVIAYRDPTTQAPAIFVANDGEANQLWRWDDRREVFVDCGVQTGIAFSGRGDAQACMGVAAADLGHDGAPDIFVTNFYQESNTLYRYEALGFFSDETASCRLQDASLADLGFGTQFLDVDLNGTMDLFIANGHEGDYRDLGIPYRMPPRLFQGVGQEFDIPQIESPYFANEHLGRAVARLDWNRDGKPDLLITHLDSPVALLENQTSIIGQPLRLKILDERRSGAEFGAQITLLDGESCRHQRLVFSGDGYMASNERSFCLSVREPARGHRLQVKWGGGGSFESAISNRFVNGGAIVLKARNRIYTLPF